MYIGLSDLDKKYVSVLMIFIFIYTFFMKPLVMKTILFIGKICIGVKFRKMLQNKLASFLVPFTE